MVLTELGSQLAGALRKLGSSTVVDQEVFDTLLKDVCRALITSDVNVALVGRFRKSVQEKVDLENLPPGVNKQQLVKRVVYEQLVAMVDPGVEPRKLVRGKPNVIMFVGLQGAGKTTTVAKYAAYYSRARYKCCMVCADTFRAGAFEQLKQNAARVRVPFYGSEYEADPVKIAREGVELFRKEGQEVIIVDTSGRHKQESALFEEMQQVAEAVNPDEIIFVMDSTIGQAVSAQAKAFKSAVPVGSVIITKMDGHAHGGGALSAVAMTGAPVVFVGEGERMDQLSEFDPESFVSQLLGWGNVKGLVKRVADVMDAETTKNLIDNITKGKYTLRDMYEQFDQISKMGSLSSIMAMLPGGLGAKLGSDAEGAARFKKFKVIMDSMTAKELDGLVKLDDSRAMRIARGSGATKVEVDQLLATHAQFSKMFGNKNMRKMMKQGDQGLATQMGRNPKAVMAQLQKSMSPAMLSQMGGAGGMMEMMKQMSMDGDMKAMMESMGGMGGLGAMMGKGGRGKGRRK